MDKTNLTENLNFLLICTFCSRKAFIYPIPSSKNNVYLLLLFFVNKIIFLKKCQLGNFFCKCLTTAAQVAAYQHQVQKRQNGRLSIQKKSSTKSLQIFDNCLSADCCRTDQTNKCKNAKEALLQS